jgi:hypothetical protein
MLAIAFFTLMWSCLSTTITLYGSAVGVVLRITKKKNQPRDWFHVLIYLFRGWAMP